MLPEHPNQAEPALGARGHLEVPQEGVAWGQAVGCVFFCATNCCAVPKLVRAADALQRNCPMPSQKRDKD